jgi:hypothetical protein
MELQTSTMVAVFVACMVVTQSLAIPISSADDGVSTIKYLKLIS